MVALVTGASSGIGEAAARRLARDGWKLVLVARREERLRALADELGDATVVAVDLTDEDAPARVAAAVESEHGRLDLLVNNAGTCDGGPLHEQSLAQITSVLDLNLVAGIDMCRLAAPLLLARPGAAVINVASIFGLVGSRAPMAAYNASKGALVHLTRHLAAQWASTACG